MTNSCINPLCITVDLEDHRLVKDLNTQRYEKNTKTILRWLKDNGMKATFFVVGEIAENTPSIIKQVAEEGHELGFHSYNHIPLTKTNPKDFTTDSQKGKDLIEDLTGKEILGFRAPCFLLLEKLFGLLKFWLILALNTVLVLFQ